RRGRPAATRTVAGTPLPWPADRRAGHGFGRTTAVSQEGRARPGGAARPAEGGDELQPDPVRPRRDDGDAARLHCRAHGVADRPAPAPPRPHAAVTGGGAIQVIPVARRDGARVASATGIRPSAAHRVSISRSTSRIPSRAAVASAGRVNVAVVTITAMSAPCNWRAVPANRWTSGLPTRRSA